MTLISPSKALYIKLGRGGLWERECLEEDQTLRVGFVAVPHELCASGDWQQVTEEYRRRSPELTTGAVTHLTNQLRLFYESEDDVLWVTFYGDLLWWCFSRREIAPQPDGTKTRPAIGGWCSTDIRGRPLSTARLSGRLTSIRGFRGTICTVEAVDYLVNTINGVGSDEAQAASQALAELELRLQALIRRLHWRDFEILVDLIFRQAGWQRVGQTGGTQKTLDLDLTSPITGERCGVQIKSQATLADFRSYQSQLTDVHGFTRFFFVVHSPAPDLAEAASMDDADGFVLWLPSTVASLSLKCGLASWIVDKAS